MTVKIKKYVAKVFEYKEHEDGTITKEFSEITLDGKRFNEKSVLNHIPRNAQLVEHGWVEVAYNIETGKLENFLKENVTPLTSIAE